MKTKNYYQGILLHWFSVIYPQKNDKFNWIIFYKSNYRIKNYLLYLNYYKKLFSL